MRLIALFLGSLAVAGSVAVGCGGDGDLFPPPSTTSTGQGGTGGGASSGGGQGGASTTSAGGAGGATPMECAVAADCDTAFGAAPCGVWACNAGVCEASSPGCLDNDQDGYGSGANCTCAGLDCNDGDDTVLGTGTRSCYSGPMGTDGIGACQAGVSSCTAGVWGPCVGEVTPSGEACNAEDDDCDGTPDDNLGTFTCGLGACATTVSACNGGVVGTCVPGAGAANDGPLCDGIDSDCDGAIDEDCGACVRVATTGNDATADGSALLPFQTIQAAINWSATHVGPKTVCVSAGAVCGTQNAPVTGTYQNANNTTVTMADGVSVLGNYERTAWTRCNGTFTTTVIQPRTAEGVTFPAAVMITTVLDGFRVERFNTPTTAAVTVDGAMNVILSNLTINNTPSVTSSYGINVVNGGHATVTKSRVDAGAGNAESIGVRSVGSTVHISGNCQGLDAFGRCDDFCFNNPSVRGRTTQGPGVTYAALLQDSPGSVVEESALCANDADSGAAIRIAGNGAGIVVRANLINAFGGAVDSHGIWMEDCGGAAPWIIDNHYIAAAGDTQQTSVDAVRALGDCHPVIDSNVRITGGGEGQASNPNGVHCGPNAQGVSSQCVVLGNQLIQGSDFGFPPIATGVRCDGDGCMRIAGNVITGRGGSASYGVWLETTSAFVDDNEVRGGCSPLAVGMHAQDASARIQNNRLFGFTQNDCTPGGPGASQQSVGLRVLVSAGGNEVDIHSNDIDGGGTPNACASAGIQFGVAGAQPLSGVGIFRNNILRSGACNTARYNVIESDVAADPRVFENNNLDPFLSPTALYYDENATALTTAAAVNALGDMTVGGVISADSLFVNYPSDLHLGPGSPCFNAGTPTGIPVRDMDGDIREVLAPDIGADEM